MLKCKQETRERLFDALEALGDVKATWPALGQLRYIAGMIEQCLVEMDERNIPKRKSGKVPPGSAPTRPAAA
jgi:hypothetical protein